MPRRVVMHTLATPAITLSPASWPNRSLIDLKKSISIMRSDNGRSEPASRICKGRAISGAIDSGAAGN